MVTIIDYNLGNLASIRNMIKKIGGQSLITQDISEIEKAEKIILPGVGAFAKGMSNLQELGLLDVLNKKAKVDKIPILGICLGMQLLSSGSTEGGVYVKGLNWIESKIDKFDSNKLTADFKIPNMGWNEIEVTKSAKIFEDIEDPRFYFTHSYHINEIEEKHVLAKATYGYSYACGIINENVIGVQFHPEKSHKFGMRFFRNFLK